MKTTLADEGSTQAPQWQELRRHNAILRAVSYGAEQFLGSESIESVLTDVLEQIGKPSASIKGLRLAISTCLSGICFAEADYPNSLLGFRKAQHMQPAVQVRDALRLWRDN